MSILIQFCFIQVIGGYANVAQLTRVYNLAGEVMVVTADGRSSQVPDKSVDEFMKRLERTCEVKK